MLQEQMNCSFSDDIDEYAEIFTSDHSIGMNSSLLIQGVLISLLLYMSVKQIPKLVTRRISGTSQLGGASMISMAKSAGNAGVKAGAAAASGGATVAKGAAGAAAKAAGSSYKAAGGGIAGIKAGAMNGMGAAINTGGGIMMSGAKGMASRALLGTKNEKGGGYSGGLLSGVYNAAQAGRGMAKSFDNRDMDPKTNKPTGEYKTMFRHANDAKDSAAQGIGKAYGATRQAAKKASDTISKVASDVKRDIDVSMHDFKK